MIIIQDTREQIPWDFSFYYTQIVEKLDTGDYTVKGYENEFVVERKKSVGEISTNLGKEVKRFVAELKRMEKFKYKHLVCEFSEQDILNFPRGSGIPRKKWRYLRMSGKFIMKRLLELCNFYDIDIHFCKNRQDAQERVVELIEEMVAGEY